MAVASTVRSATQPLRVLGLDPGSRITGFGLVEGVGPKERCVEAGVIHAGSGDMPARLGTIYRGVLDAIVRLRPDVMAVEQVFVARSADSALKLGQARGAAIAAVVMVGVPVAEYAARRVKQAVTGTGAATKYQVQHMVCRLLSLTSAPSADAADALAIAITHLNTKRYE